jgi:hypothetical protein
VSSEKRNGGYKCILFDTSLESESVSMVTSG